MGSGSSHLQSADPGEMMVQEPNGCQLEDCILLGEAGLLFSSGLLLPGGGPLTDEIHMLYPKFPNINVDLTPPHPPGWWLSSPLPLRHVSSLLEMEKLEMEKKLGKSDAPYKFWANRPCFSSVTASVIPTDQRTLQRSRSATATPPCVCEGKKCFSFFFFNFSALYFFFYLINLTPFIAIPHFTVLCFSELYRYMFVFFPC